MFEERYNRMLDGVHPSKTLVSRTLSSVRRPKQSPHWKPLLITALCVLLVAVPFFLKITYTPDASRIAAQPIPTATPAPTNAPAPTDAPAPPALECTYDGMTLKYLSSWADEEKLYVTLSVEGEQLPEQMSLSLMTDSGAICIAQPVSHDPDRHKSIYLAEFELESLYAVIAEDGRSAKWLNPIIDLSLPVTLHVTGYTSYLSVPLADTLPLDQISTNPAMQIKSRQELINGYDNKDFMTYCFTGYPVLVPGENLTDPIAGYAIVAAGFTDNRLHVLLTSSASNQSQLNDLPKSYLEPVLLTAGYTGNIFGSDMPSQIISTYECFYWKDEATQITYQDYVFDHSREELLGMSESMQLYLRGYVAFSFPDGTEPPMSLTFSLGE